MKKLVNFTAADGQKYELSLSIRDTMNLEADINTSLFAFINEVVQGNLRSMTLNFTMAVLRRALPKLETDEKLEQIIESHCAAGGTLDGINQALLTTIFNTGLFTPGEAVGAEETANP